MQQRRLVAAAVVCLAPATALAQSVPSHPNTVLAPLAGRHYQPATGQDNIGFYGTDLGFTYSHQGQLRILFGDTWANGTGGSIGPIGDDSQGAICLASGACPCCQGATTFPDGAAVESYVASHPPSAGELSWQNDGPPLFFRLNGFNLVAPLPVYRGGIFGTLLNMGPGRTPVAAFSNAKTGGQSAAFGIFNRGVSVQCSGGFFPSCPDQLTCDTGLGSYLGATTEEAIPCLLGSAGCAPIPARGFCVDATNSFHEPPGDGAARLYSVATKMEVGNADPNAHEVYYTKSWGTRRFFNPAVRAVNDFLPSRANGAGNDYNLPDSSTTGRERLLLWGRPGFVGAKANQRDAKLYFAYVDMPNYDFFGNIAWNPQYYTGRVGGVPQFSGDQEDALALDLNGSPSADSEVWDIVDQMTVAFIPGLNKWVMLYGGDVSDGLADLFSGGQGAAVVHDPEGAIHVRFSESDDPWGPFSAPVPLLVAGDPSAGPVAGSQYGPGGILHHPDCDVADCAPFEPTFGDGERGFFYGPNIIPEWTRDHPGYVEIFWNVSTWNPYQVVLIKSRIDK